MPLRARTCTIMMAITTFSFHREYAVVCFFAQQAWPEITKLSTLGYNTAKPATGAEYKVMVCRSTSATGGFVCSLSVMIRLLDIS